MLSFKHWSLGYDAPNILKGVNLTLKAGDKAALVGQNGVGKTSLLHSIMGLIPQVDGDLMFNNNSLRGKQTHSIAQLGIALVKQENAVFSDLSVKAHFDLLNAKDMQENLKYFPDLLLSLNRLAKHLSGGQRQQLAIAMALATKPSLLLLDEPSANVQPSTIESMIAVLNQINEEQGVAILIAEQNLSVISRVANEAYLIESGRLQEDAIIVKGLDKKGLFESLSQRKQRV